MALAVIIPWAGNCPHREAALDWVLARYATLGWQTIIGEANAEAWSKAEAVADGLTQTDADLLVIADADCWADDITPAVAAVRAGDAWAVPHRKVHRLNEQATQRVLEGETPNPKMRLARVAYTGVIGGGIVVVPRSLYEQAPLDPRFVGWGGEDHSLGYALRTFAGPPHRATGRLWHLWHPKQHRDPAGRVSGNRQNETLRRRYSAATRDPEAMRQLIEEGRQWTSHGSSTAPQRSSTPSNPTISTTTATR